MPKFLEAPDFLQLDDCVLLDVRSPSEYSRAHIPGAHSFPLFTDDERAQVGTCYKHEGPEDAMLLGLEFVGPKMADFVRQARGLNPDKKRIRIYCFRGGKRSQSMAWLLEQGGFKVEILQGGYKQFRRHVKKSFHTEQEFIVLSGCTGSAKTRILLALKEMGEQVIDLEGLAQHRGSAFGGYHQPSDFTTERFENALYFEWRDLRRNRRLWVEDEGRTLGRVFIPEGFWPQMRAAPVVFIDVPQPERVKFLVQEYGEYDYELLLGSVNRIEKRLGPETHKKCVEAMEANDYAEVVRHSLDYYDRAYLHCLKKRDAKPLYELPLPEIKIEENAEKILAFADEKTGVGVVQ